MSRSPTRKAKAKTKPKLKFTSVRRKAYRIMQIDEVGVNNFFVPLDVAEAYLEGIKASDYPIVCDNVPYYDPSILREDRASHQIHDMWIEDGFLVADIGILKTSNGKEVELMLKSGAVFSACYRASIGKGEVVGKTVKLVEKISHMKAACVTRPAWRNLKQVKMDKKRRA